VDGAIVGMNSPILDEPQENAVRARLADARPDETQRHYTSQEIDEQEVAAEHETLALLALQAIHPGLPPRPKAENTATVDTLETTQGESSDDNLDASLAVGDEVGQKPWQDQVLDLDFRRSLHGLDQVLDLDFRRSLLSVSQHNCLQDEDFRRALLPSPQEKFRSSCTTQADEDISRRPTDGETSCTSDESRATLATSVSVVSRLTEARKEAGDVQQELTVCGKTLKPHLEKTFAYSCDETGNPCVQRKACLW